MSAPNIVGAVILAAMLIAWVVLYLQARRAAQIVVWFDAEENDEIVWDDE